MLSSKVVHTNQSYNVSLHTRPSRASKGIRRFTTTGGKDGVAGPSGRAEHDMEICACASGANSRSRRSESQERIIQHSSFGIAASDVDLAAVGPSRADVGQGDG